MSPEALAKITQAAAIMDEELSRATNLTPLDRKITAYYAIATYSLQNAKKFPLLVFFGPTNTGKTEACETVNDFALEPVFKSMRGLSDALLRDIMAVTHRRTLIFEEADSGFRVDSLSFEGLLKLRYSDSAASEITVLKGNETNKWTPVAEKLFGALVLHRQKPFNDASLTRRCITIRTVPNLRRKYEPLTHRGAGMLKDLEPLMLPEISLPRLPPSIVERYAPVLGISLLLDDLEFVQALTQKLRDEEVSALQEAQESEPTLLVLRSLMGKAFIDGGSDYNYGSAKASDLAEWIKQESGLVLTPRQVIGIARSLGLARNIEVKVSHGVTKLKPQPLTLLKACRTYGYTDDEAYEKLERICQLLPNRVDEVEITHSIEKEMSTSSTVSPINPDLQRLIEELEGRKPS